MSKTDYSIPVLLDTEIRVRHTVQRGKVIEFMVQLEVQGETVIRYDSAHGFAHIDRYNLKGERKKERLKLDFNDALTLAERDIKGNWPIYRERFLKGGFP